MRDRDGRAEQVAAGPDRLADRRPPMEQFLTDTAATALRLSQVGLAHSEEYPDAGRIQGRIVELDGP